jgi:glycosyltransferase involved in cell wall biosynthesis
VFSHLKSTCEVLPRLFNSKAITEKVHYMPLGSPEGDRPTKKQFERKCAAALRGSEPRRILFTSSFNQSDWSFFSRGGLYVVNAFLELADEFDDIELVLRSTIPVGLKKRWADAIISHPRIDVLHRKLSNHDIADLYAGSEIMAFPSYTLHCQSLFRAMYSGAICVISDAPDYAEFIVDRRTAVVAKRGSRAAYERDELGMTREHYPEMRMFDEAFAHEVTAAFRYVLENRARANGIRRRARQTVVQRYPRARMFKAFDQILTRSDARLRAITKPR